MANAVLAALSLAMPEIDLDSLRAMPMPQRRRVMPPPRPSESPDAQIDASTVSLGRVKPNPATLSRE